MFKPMGITDNIGQLEAQVQKESIPSSKPIHNTTLRRWFFLILIRIVKPFRQRKGGVLFLSDSICVKYGPLKNLSEASTMQFVAQHTSIPVPRVICSFTHRSWTYIVMEKIHGDMIGQGWLARSADSKTKKLLQLRKYITELRGLTPKDLRVSSVDGGMLFDCRIHGPLHFGPFDSIQTFHRYLRSRVSVNTTNPPGVNELISWHDGSFWSAPVFTHGDLSSLNILVRGEEIVGIIDWETAGWFPDYWEYTTAAQVNPQNLFWKDELDAFLDPMPTGLSMEKIRQKYFGDF